jgi:hypothetical protein
VNDRFDRFLLSLRHAEVRAQRLAEFTARYRAANDSFAAFIAGKRPARSEQEIADRKAAS